MPNSAQSLSPGSVCADIKTIQPFPHYSSSSDDCQKAWFEEGRDGCHNVLATCSMIRDYYDPNFRPISPTDGLPPADLVLEHCQEEWSGGKPVDHYFLECYRENLQPNAQWLAVKVKAPCARDKSNSFLNNPCLGDEAGKKEGTPTTTERFSTVITASTIEAISAFPDATEGNNNTIPRKETSNAVGGSGFTLRQSIITSAIVACVGLYATAVGGYNDL